MDVLQQIQKSLFQAKNHEQMWSGSTLCGAPWGLENAVKDEESKTREVPCHWNFILAKDGDDIMNNYVVRYYQTAFWAFQECTCSSMTDALKL